MKKTFWLILVLVVGGLIGLFAISTKDSPDKNNSQTVDHARVETDEHIRGDAEAKLTLIEYGDFQCPACRSVAPWVKQLLKDYDGQLRLVFRHFPLSAIHPNAFAGARAAQAAGAQGKFWEMHDLLYERQDQWSSSSSAQSLFRDWAAELRLNLDQFNEAYNAAVTTDLINRQITLGQSAGATGTPTFVLDGQKVDPNPRTYAEFKTKIEAALKGTN